MFQKINNFFSEKDLEKILSEHNHLYKKKLVKKNNNWNQNVKEFSKPIDLIEIDEDNEFYSIILNSCIKNGINNNPKGINFFYWPPGSYIPWHNDGNHAAALTIYLNKSWDWEDGGLFQYYQNGEIKTEIPKFNTGFFQNDGLWHSTTISSELSPVRKTIQIFYNESISASSFSSKGKNTLI